MNNSVAFSTLLFSGLFFISYSVHAQGINIGTGGNMVITGAATIQIDNGGLVNDGTYTKGTETVTFSGNTARTISGTSNMVINNLSITNTGGLTTQLGLLTATNITIGVGSKFTIPTGKAVTVTTSLANNSGSAAGLLLESGSEASNSSLIQPSASVTATSQRFMTKGVWHIISFPESGQPISSFLQSVPNSIGYNSTTSEWGMMPYDPSINNWSSFYTSATPGNFEKGKGYMVRRKNSGSDGVVTSSGELYYGDFTITGLTPGKWNCVGNPYTSALGATNLSISTSNLLTVNGTELETSFGAIYIWDEQADYNDHVLRNDYKVLNNSGFISDLTKGGLQVGQGFLVKMGTLSTDLIFQKNMQLHLVTEPYVKKSAQSWPGFELIVTTKDFTNTAIVTFNDKMTKGLDPTYDAGAIKGNAKLSLYTRLLEDNGTDFLIQCLPLEGIESFVIPVGLDFPDGGQITFSAKTDLIEPGSFVILEDRSNGVFTDLVSVGSGYTINLPASTFGTGRFYLHTGDGSSNSIPNIKENLNVYSFGNKIYINGEITQKSEIMLYSILGELVRIYNPESSNNRQLNADGLVKGLYLLKIRDKQFIKTYKLFIEDGL